MSLPTTGQEFEKLIEHIRLAQEAAYRLGHLVIDEDKLKAQGWRAVAEQLGITANIVQRLQVARRGRIESLS